MKPVLSTAISFACGRKPLDQFVEEGLPFVKGLDTHSFVASVEANVIAIHEEPLDAITGNSLRTEIAAVRRTHDHDGNSRNARPHAISDVADGFEQIRTHW